MSLNDICCYIPAWFGVIASILVGMIAYECTLQCNTRQSIVGVVLELIQRNKANTTNNNNDNNNLAQLQNQQSKRKLIKGDTGDSSAGTSMDQNGSASDETDGDTTFLNLSSPSTECGIAAMGIMGMVPAHLTRSIGGGFDNESVAMSAMCLTFYFWVRSLRANDEKSYLYGIATGVAYFYVSLLDCIIYFTSILNGPLTTIINNNEDGSKLGWVCFCPQYDWITCYCFGAARALFNQSLFIV